MPIEVRNDWDWPHLPRFVRDEIQVNPTHAFQYVTSYLALRNEARGFHVEQFETRHWWHRLVARISGVPLNWWDDVSDYTWPANFTVHAVVSEDGSVAWL